MSNFDQTENGEASVIAFILEVIGLAPYQRHAKFADRNFGLRRLAAGRVVRWVRFDAVALAPLQLRHVSGHSLVRREQILGRLEDLGVVRRRRAAHCADRFRIVIASCQQLCRAFAHFYLQIDFLLQIQFLQSKMERKTIIGLRFFRNGRCPGEQTLSFCRLNCISEHCDRGDENEHN